MMSSALSQPGEPTLNLACARRAKFFAVSMSPSMSAPFGAGELRVRDLALLLIGHGELAVADRGERLLLEPGAKIRDGVVEQTASPPQARRRRA